MKYGMYPTDKKERYKAERIVDVITTDCQFHNEEYALLVLNQQ